MVELKEADFINTLEEMLPQWYALVQALKISQINLAAIEEKEERDRYIMVYMKAMLQEWLRTGNATWEMIYRAVISNSPECRRC